MKRILWLAAFITAPVSLAQANSDSSLGGGVDYAMLSNAGEFKDPPNFDLNLDSDIYDRPYRIEGEVLYNNSKYPGIPKSKASLNRANDTRLHSVTGLTNLLVDMPVSSGVTPYVGGGLGMAEQRDDAAADSSLAYQFLTGVNLKNADGSALYAGYRYYKAGESNIQAFQTPYETQNFEVGFRYPFAAPQRVYETAAAEFIDDAKVDDNYDPHISTVKQQAMEEYWKRRANENRVPLRELTSPKRIKPEPAVAQVVEPKAEQVLPFDSKQYFYIKVGAFQKKENAVRLKYLLKDLGKTYIEEVKTDDNNVIYRVYIGSTKKETVANQVLAEVQDMGYEAAYVVVK